MGKGKDKKKPKVKKANASSGKKSAAAADIAGSAKRGRVAKAVKGAKRTAVKLAENPVVVDLVAATLVAAAAAIRNPKKARKMAQAAADEIGDAGKGVARGGSAVWDMALEIARRSLDALGDDVAKGGGGKRRK